MSVPPVRRMLTRRVGNVLLLLQGPEPFADAEWSECLEILRPFVAQAKALVVTRGAGPTPAQRKRLSEVIGKYPMRAAIVTDSVKVYFIVSSVALFMPRIRSFRFSEFSEAFAHLGLTPTEIDQVRRNLAEMREQVSEASA